MIYPEEWTTWGILGKLPHYRNKVKVLPPRLFLAECIFLFLSIFVYTELVGISCLSFQGGVAISVLGEGKVSPILGLVPTQGVPPFFVVCIYVLVTVLICLDLWVGARSLIHIKLMGDIMVEKMRTGDGEIEF